MSLLATLALAAALVPAAGTPSAPAQDQDATAILAAYDGLTPPRYDPARRGEDGYVQEYLAERSQVEARQAELIGALALADPGHGRLPALLPKRWALLVGGDPESQNELLVELDGWIARADGSALALDAHYQKGQLARAMGDPRLLAQVIDDFRAAAPDDDRGARLLSTLAGMHTDGSAEQRAVYTRLIEQYGQTRTAGFARGKLRQIDGLGQPFALAFDDAVSGERVDLAQLRGQVVVIDFWATWCGPCVAEMPAMKALYAEFHERGVEFVGVSLDNSEERGGLEALRAYVAEHEVPWRQYYQGAGWDGEFSVSWGINSIPALFVVDKQGRLAHTDARGKLEQILPALLAAEG